MTTSRSSLPSPIKKQDIPTVDGLLTIVTVTVSQLRTIWPWSRIRRDICKPIMHAACTSRVFHDPLTLDIRQRCVSQCKGVDETDDSIEELWQLCKEAARAREAVAVVDDDQLVKAKVVFNFLVMILTFW